MQFMLILAADPEAWAHNTPEPDGVIDDWTLYTRALHAAGVLVAGHGLHGTDAATTVRVRSSKTSLTDGPFTETKEHLIGYYIIEVADLDQAIRWAERAPNVRIGSVEVRPVMPGSATDSVLAGND
jgi:hypothetical protein